MGEGYTELFFLDEVTALAAGHRPCFQCRRRDAVAFADAWGRSQGLGRVARAWEIDLILHAERIEQGPNQRRGKRTARADVRRLPPGAMVALWGATWLVSSEHLLRWSFDGYVQAIRLPDAEAELLTPLSIVAALDAGYRPQSDSALFPER